MKIVGYALILMFLICAAISAALLVSILAEMWR